MSQHKLQGRGVINTTCQLPDAFIAMPNNQVVVIDKIVMYEQWVPDTKMKVPKAQMFKSRTSKRIKEWYESYATCFLCLVWNTMYGDRADTFSQETIDDMLYQLNRYL